tara:strand:- start:17 stop:472 length:456 start_codon:yes stop_codon:yes gene_type:complete
MASKPMRRALQCLVLLEWVGNLHLARWAERYLPPRAFALYQSEVLVEPSSSPARDLFSRLETLVTPAASSSLHSSLTTRHDGGGSDKNDAGTAEGRRLAYGEWRRLLRPSALGALGACGGWRAALAAISSRTGYVPPGLSSPGDECAPEVT